MVAHKKKKELFSGYMYTIQHKCRSLRAASAKKREYEKAGRIARVSKRGSVYAVLVR